MFISENEVLYMNKFLPVLIMVLVFLSACQTETDTIINENTNASKNESESLSENLYRGAEYTLDDVVLHNSESDCWTVINGNVYDLTEWINNHPGGSSAIISLCGKDGSSAFNAQHGGSSGPEMTLEEFYVGALI